METKKEKQYKQKRLLIITGLLVFFFLIIIVATSILNMDEQVDEDYEEGVVVEQEAEQVEVDEPEHSFGKGISFWTILIVAFIMWKIIFREKGW